MLSKIPIDLNKTKPEDINKEVLRAAVIAELDAINLYEQLANITTDEKLRKVFLDIAKEEKTHMGEFQTMLLMHDKEQEAELIKGKEEINKLLEGKE